MNKTKWSCEKCGKSGTARHGEHAGVYQVYIDLKTSHGKSSPSCRFDMDKVRVEEVPASSAKRKAGRR